jgi:hypothetical protein
MLLLVSRRLPAVLLAAVVILASGALAGIALAQSSGEQKPADQKQAEVNEGQRNQADFAEAARQLGGPAANPECVWHGRRVISLLRRDDVDTAFRHLDLYDRFGCPGGHVQASLRCLLGQDTGPSTGSGAGERMDRRAQSCWINPSQQAASTPAVAPAAPAAAAATGQAPAQAPAGGTTPK